MSMPRWVRGPAVAAVFALLATGLVGCGSTGGVSAPEDAVVSVAFGLKRDQSGLQSALDSTSTPGQPEYTKYLSPDEIADQFGADADVVQTTLQAASDAGFTGSSDPTRGVISGTMTVEKARQLFGVDFELQETSEGGTYISPRESLSVPPQLAETVSEVTGGVATVSQVASGSPTPTATASFPPPKCPDIGPTRDSLRKSVRRMLGLTAEPDPALTGAGIRAALLEVGYYSKQSVQIFRECYGDPVPPIAVEKVNTTDQQLYPQGSETTVDVAAISIAAPKLDGIHLYQFDPQTSFVFPLAALMQAQVDSATKFDVVSSSVAFCSDQVTGAPLAMSEWLIMALGMTGATMTASSGDTGSSGCYPSNEGAAVQYPSASAYVTSVGGTMQPSSTSTSANKRPVVWNASPEQQQAGGGGPAANGDRPDYQSALGGPENRQTPDVALLADPVQVGPLPVCNLGSPCTFEQVAGTSGAAPAFAGSVALTLASLRKANPAISLGPLNPAIYRIAGGRDYDTAFVDVTTGNNDLFNVGCCTATTGYDMASGWGTPVNVPFTKLVRKQLPRS